MGEATIWSPRTILAPAEDVRFITQRFVATADQAVFTITGFAYTVASGSLDVYKDGLLLVSGYDYTEVSDTSFALAEVAAEGSIIVARGAVGIEGTVPLAVIPSQSPRYTGDGVTTTFASPSTTYVDEPAFFINLSGVTQRPYTDFIVDGTGQVIFTVAPASGVEIDIILYAPQTSTTTAANDVSFINADTSVTNVQDKVTDVETYLNALQTESYTTATTTDLSAILGLPDGWPVDITAAKIGGRFNLRNVVAHGFTSGRGVFIRLDDDNYLERRTEGKCLAAWWQVDIDNTAADNNLGLDECFDYAEKYGLVLDLPSTKDSSGADQYVDIKNPWQIRQRVTIRGKGEDTRLRKITSNVGTGSNTAPERPLVTDSYAVDAVIILEHPESAFALEANFEDFRVYGNQTGIGIYRPRHARSYIKNVMTNDTEYGDRTFSNFLMTFEQYHHFDPNNSLISGYSWIDDGSFGGTGTSCTFTTCYSFGSSDDAWSIYGLDYSTWNSCAADSFGDGSGNVYAYKLTLCKGITMNSCGCEGGQGGGMFELSGTTGAINAPKAFNLTAINNSALINVSSSSSITINEPRFDDWAGVTGTARTVWSSSGVSQVVINGGTEPSNSTIRFDGINIFKNIVTQNLVSANNGDSDLALTIDSYGTQRFASTLTANRTVTAPSAADGWNGLEFTIARTAATPGAFTLDVAGVHTISANTRGTVTIMHNGSGWVLKSAAIIP